MSRSADYTIQGFHYQLNKTLLETLTNGNQVIVVEGTEDIDILNDTEITHIQCKYHEAREKFTLGLVYKPIIEFMLAYSLNYGKPARYVLFIHTADRHDGLYELTVGDIAAILQTRNKEIRKLISKVKPAVAPDAFVSRVRIEFGPKYDDLKAQIYSKLAGEGFSDVDVDALVYPNAIHLIGTVSIRHDQSERTITKSQLVEFLRANKQAIISSWTLAVSNRKRLLALAQKKVLPWMKVNSTRRALVLGKEILTDDPNVSDLVRFIADFVRLYSFKVAHTHPPLFCFEMTLTKFSAVFVALNKKGIRATSGYIFGEHFDVNYLLRDPLVGRAKNEQLPREFQVRLALTEHLAVIALSHHPDIVFSTVDERLRWTPLARHESK